jgi:hypothetical protein
MTRHDLPSLWRGERRNKRLAADDAVRSGACNEQIFGPR